MVVYIEMYLKRCEPGGFLSALAQSIKHLSSVMSSVVAWPLGFLLGNCRIDEYVYFRPAASLRCFYQNPRPRRRCETHRQMRKELDATASAKSEP